MPILNLDRKEKERQYSEEYRNNWHTWDEICFATRMFNKKKGDMYEKSLATRDIWEDENGTKIDKGSLMIHIEQLKGGNGCLPSD